MLPYSPNNIELAVPILHMSMSKAQFHRVCRTHLDRSGTRVVCQSTQCLEEVVGGLLGSQEVEIPLSKDIQRKRCFGTIQGSWEQTGTQELRHGVECIGTTALVYDSAVYTISVHYCIRDGVGIILCMRAVTTVMPQV